MTILPLMAIVPLLLMAADAFAQPAPDDKSDQGISRKYQELVAKTQDTSPLIKDIFANSYVCGGVMGKNAVATAEQKAVRETQANHEQLSKDKKTFDGANQAIQNAINTKLKGKLQPDVTGVNICKGEVDSIKRLFSDAKQQAKASANEKIDSIAKDLTGGSEKLIKQINEQLNKNDADRPSDLSKLDIALSTSFTAAPKAACQKVIDYVKSSQADKQMIAYRSELEKLGKNISSWKEAKKSEVGAQIDAQLEKAQGTMLAGKNCEEGKTAAAEDNSRESGVSKASQKPATAKTEQKKNDDVSGAATTGSTVAGAGAGAGVAAAKNNESIGKQDSTEDITGQSEKSPASDTVAEAAKNAPKAQDTAESLTKKDGKSNAADVTGTFLSETAKPDESAVPVQGLDLDPATDQRIIAESKAPAAPEVQDLDSSRTAANNGNNAPPPVQGLEDDVPQRGLYNVKELKTSYQSDPIFKSRDLDFNSTKDTTYIQKALNDVRAQNGQPPISTDGSFGSRTTIALDQVMKDPTQKAAFLKSLRTQMSSNRSTASR